MKIVIIGNGISGITAARWIRKLSDFQIQVVSSESQYFYSRTALMYIYMGHMKMEDTQPYEEWFWKKNRIELIHEHVKAINFTTNKIQLVNGENVPYDKLLLALGSKSNKFGWPGQDLNGVTGLYHLQDLEKMEEFSDGLKKAVIVGGGLIGVEMAEMFHSRHIPVTMIVREDHYWDNVLPKEEAALISDHIRSHGIDLRLQTNLREIEGDGDGMVRAIIIKETGERIQCGFVGLTPGVSPRVDLLTETQLQTNRGILVDEHLQTNIPGVYAVGDCAELRNPPEGRRPIEAVWYTGRMMGETVAHNICGKSIKYDPGIWYNSAKFFDIEYQVYGTVLNHPPPEHESILWLEKENNKSLRIVYHRQTSSVIGFNLLGIRFRQEVCLRWIKNKTRIEEVLKNLRLANFDPEFHSSIEEGIVRSYSRKMGSELELVPHKGLDAVIHFLQSTENVQ